MRIIAWLNRRRFHKNELRYIIARLDVLNARQEIMMATIAQLTDAQNANTAASQASTVAILAAIAKIADLKANPVPDAVVTAINTETSSLMADTAALTAAVQG